MVKTTPGCILPTDSCPRKACGLCPKSMQVSQLPMTMQLGVEKFPENDEVAAIWVTRLSPSIRKSRVPSRPSGRGGRVGRGAGFQEECRGEHRRWRSGHGG